MDHNFRGRIRYGWVTLNVGEKALVYALEGQARIETGPERLFLWREKFQRLLSYRATQDEYLVIRYLSGKLEHKLGPCVMFMNPVEHDKITVAEGTQMDANEVLVVYRNSKVGDVERYIVHGPTTFFPRADEWLHSFCWHGTDPNNKTKKIPGTLQFTKLQIIPDQFYFNVDEVRTSDHALIRVKLMFFYELKDIEKMLNATRDPIADFVNCLTADVVTFTAKLPYVEFVEKSCELNELDKYPQLLERCKMIGYEVSKVVFRGYHAAPKLQQVHNQAIHTRTELKIDYESEVQKQATIDMNLAAELQRESLEQSMALESLRHKQDMEKRDKTHKLAMKKRECEEHVRRLFQDKKTTLEAKKEKDAQTVDYYTKLRGMNVNMNEYVQSLSPHPNKVIKILADSNAANIHWHQTSV